MFKKIAFIFVVIWVVGFFAANVCLANNYHSCCPTQTADWHSDTATSPLATKVFVDLNSFDNIAAEDTIAFVPQFALIQISHGLAPPTSLLTKLNHQVHAPPSA